MAKKSVANVGQASSLSPKSKKSETGATPVLRPSSLLDTRVIYCGDNLEQLARLPGAGVDLICIDPPRPVQKEEGRMMKPARLKILHSSFCLLNSPVTGSFYYHCDWHASHCVKVMPDQIFGENNFQNNILNAA